MSSKRHHRHRRQGGTNPTTEPQNSPGVAQFSVSEVAQFSVSLDKRDISRHPERLQPITADLVDRLHSLVGDLDVDLDAPLPDDDTRL
jgi:hypothetical protein